ncbi:MAG: mycothiol synthase [Actinomycetota bacterium]
MRALDVRREMDSAGIDEVSALLTAAWNADGSRPLSDHLWLDLREGGRRGFAGVLMRDDHHDHLVAYCQLSRGNSSWSLDLVVHPHHRYDSHEIAPILIETALGIVAEEGGGHVHWWVFEPTNLHVTLARDAGFTPGRRLLQMRVPLPLGGPASSLAVEPFRPGIDDDEWLSVNNAAFAHHPEQGGWDRGVLDARRSEPWFDPTGFLVHRRDGAMAGFCWTKIHADDGSVDDQGRPMGEIYVIAVHPSATGGGLGTDLVRAGLAHLASRGVATGMLYVDEDNAVAVAMYRRLGFLPHHTEVAFVGDVRR